MGALMPFEEALARVMAAVPRPRRETVPLPRAQGRILARDIRADRNLPPFDRATLDGYAVRVRAEFGGMQILPVVGEVAAGQTPPRSIPPDSCLRVWTGAAVPPGAQGVVPIERAREHDGHAYLEGPLEIGGARRPGIADRGEDARRGGLVIERGSRITPAAATLLASVGVAEVPVFAEADLAVAVTGHELVPSSAKPRPTQIRSANDETVAAIAEAIGVSVVSRIGLVEDEPAALRRAMRRGLGHDLLVVTGGVSAGRLDLVPDILRELGVRIVLHRVAIRPGKPFLFGIDSKGGRRTAVFGLPGNPVSVLATAVVFLSPFLRAWRGEPAATRTIRVRTVEPLRRDGGLLHFVPCTIHLGAQGCLTAREIPSHGSGDFVSSSSARAFLRIPGDGVTRPRDSILDADLIPGCSPDVEER